MREFQGFPWSTYQTWCFGRIQDYAGATVIGTIQDRSNATVRLIRGVAIPRIIVGHASGSSS
eukprot:1252313-Pyramimonas_sp.AAC.1